MPRIAQLLLVATIAAVCFGHLYRLASVPHGLYVDESSIGLNAALIAESGRDEHGEAFPLYFKAFGEYKNPLYVYSAAALFRLAGVSEYTLRLTSALWFLLAVALLAWLIQRLFPDRPVVLVYGLLAFGFMPQTFNLSRVAFEVTSELPLFVAALIAIHAAVEPPAQSTALPASGRGAGRLGPGGDARVRDSALAGLLLGLSAYAYSTNRLYSPLFVAAIVLVYARRAELRALASLCATFALTLVPMLVFMKAHPGAMTGRLQAVSYIGSPSLSLGQKFSTFVSHYAAHLGPEFLLTQGDTNLRHMTGVGGALSWAVFALALAGLIALIRDPAIRQSRFAWLVLLLLLLAPVPAGLTDAAHGHALRSLPLALFFLLLSCYGLDFVERAAGARRASALAVCFGLLLLQTAAYLEDYFLHYPAASVDAFESAGFQQMLALAVAQHPREVRYTDHLPDPSTYTHAEFERRALHLPKDYPLRFAGDEAVSGSCFIYFVVPPYAPRGLVESFRNEDPNLASHLVCYR